VVTRMGQRSARTLLSFFYTILNARWRNACASAAACAFYHRLPSLLLAGRAMLSCYAARVNGEAHGGEREDRRA